MRDILAAYGPEQFVPVSWYVSAPYSIPEANQRYGWYSVPGTPTAWFDGITVKGDPQKGSKVVMPGNVQGDDKSRLANFHDDIEASEFAKDLKSKSMPTFKLETDDSRIPPAYLRFPLELEFKKQAGDGKGKPGAKKGNNK